MESENNIIAYFNKHKIHSAVLYKLREILMDFPFEETIKWSMPTYVFDQKNLMSIGAFKKHIGLWFFQGALLKDKDRLLHNAQEGKTKAMRQIHFYTLENIDEGALRRYISETIENQKKGLFVSINKTPIKVVIPDELSIALKNNADSSEHFFKLTPGKQKEYCQYISSAIREKTKSDRLKKIIPLIN